LLKKKTAIVKRKNGKSDENTTQALKESKRQMIQKETIHKTVDKGEDKTAKTCTKNFKF